MKVAHLVAGNTFPHKRELFNDGYQWNSKLKVWSKLLADDIDNQDSHELLSSLPGIEYKMVDYDCLREGNEKWLADEVSALKMKVKSTVDSFSYKSGDQIEIKAWLAKRIQKELNMDIFFRNLEIVSMKAETNKAILCTVKFVSDVAQGCHLCGRPLEDQISVATGIGPVCLNKIGIKRAKLEDAHKILEEINKLCEELGETPEIWIAKSQIKRDLGRRD